VAVISAEGLDISLGDSEILRGISLSVEAGRTLAVLGPSGCGKTTLLRALAGLLPATGRIDRPPARPGHAGVTFVFQDPRLLPWLRVRANITFALESAGVPRGQWAERIDPLMAAVGLQNLDRRWPAALSGGMAQRVALVRALAVRPAVLLLDEPFAALDPQRREQLQVELQLLVAQSRCAAIIVTHDVTEALVLGDEVVVLGGQPGQIRSRMAVTAPRPRGDAFRLSDETLKLRRRIRAALSSSSGADPSP
jgi:NitT/TauT family transport system ATP-binding protein